MDCAFHAAWLDIRPGFETLQAGDLSVADGQLTLVVADPPEQFQQEATRFRSRQVIEIFRGQHRDGESPNDRHGNQ